MDYCTPQLHALWVRGLWRRRMALGSRSKNYRTDLPNLVPLLARNRSVWCLAYVFGPPWRMHGRSASVEPCFPASRPATTVGDSRTRIREAGRSSEFVVSDSRTVFGLGPPLSDSRQGEKIETPISSPTDGGLEMVGKDNSQGLHTGFPLPVHLLSKDRCVT